MIYSDPVWSRKNYQAHYTSYFFSPYNIWFRELGYPLLDIIKYNDGEWCIYQAHNKPHIPAETKWHEVLTKLRNVEITKGFVEKYTLLHDLTRGEKWDIENKKTKDMLDEKDRLEEHSKDVRARAYQAIAKNEGLMERIARNGIHEMDLASIAKHIPSYRF